MQRGNDEVATAVNAFSRDLPGFIATIKTCRGVEIISGEKAIKLEKRIAKVEETSLAPFNPIFSRIKSQIKQFALSNNIKNGFIAVDWCIKNGSVQQGLTILQESIISLVCESEKLEIINETNRMIVGSAFKILEKKYPETSWEGECAKKENIALTRRLCKNTIVKTLFPEFAALTNSRNDINHCGMRDSPSKANKFEKNLKELYFSVLTKTANS